MTIARGPLAKAHRLLAPRVAFLVGTRSPTGEPNLIPVSNTTSVSTDPEQVLVAVLKRWTTHANLQTGTGFTVSVPSNEQAEGVWKLGARYSGYTVPDNATKLATCGLPIDETASDYGPVLANGYGWLACRTVARLDVAGDHGLTVGQVELVAFDDALFNAEGTPVKDLTPLMQVTGNRFTTVSTCYELPYLS